MSYINMVEINRGLKSSRHATVSTKSANDVL